MIDPFNSQLVDPALGKSLAHLEEYVAAKEAVESDDSHVSLSYSLPLIDEHQSYLSDFAQSSAEREQAIKAIEVRGATVSDLTLDFTLPGTDIELKQGGKDITVEMENVGEYVQLVIDWTLGRGVAEQVTAFKQGFSTGEPTSLDPVSLR